MAGSFTSLSMSEAGPPSGRRFVEVPTNHAASQRAATIGELDPMGGRPQDRHIVLSLRVSSRRRGKSGAKIGHSIATRMWPRLKEDFVVRLG